MNSGLHAWFWLEKKFNNLNEEVGSFMMSAKNVRKIVRVGFQSVALAWVLTNFGLSAHAADLKTPFALETAATLPAGIRNPRFIDVFTSITSKFTDTGGTEPLGNPLNKVVTWNDVLNAQEDAAKRTNVAAILSKNGLRVEGSPGVTTGEVNTFADVKVAALAIGLTDRLTIAGVLPIVRINVSAATGFVANSDAQQFVRDIGLSSNPLTAEEAANKLDDAVNQKLIRLGYQPIPSSQTISGVGDAQMIAKYRLHDDGVNSVALKGSLIFPTGIAPDPDKALDIPTGDGRYGLGFGAIYDRKLPWDFRWNIYGTYTALLPHTVVKRIPTSVEDKLSADKEGLQERTRSQVALGTGLEHHFSGAGISLGGGYAFQYMTRADYRPGTLVDDPGRYLLLDEIQPLESLHSVLASAGFSTVEWYKAKKFVYPFQVNFSYTHPLTGRNVAANDLLVGELVLFF
ncbi:hypothetical protein WDW37_13105 [Bdellovibrionota bacterium FG-1]